MLNMSSPSGALLSCLEVFFGLTRACILATFCNTMKFLAQTLPLHSLRIIIGKRKPLLMYDRGAVGYRNCW